MADASLQQLKICSGCKVERPLSDFHRHKRSKDGVRQRCKPCRAQEVADDRSKNPDKYKERHRRYYEKYRDNVIARTSAYSKANSDVRARAVLNYVGNPANKKKLLETWKKYRDNNRAKIAEYRKANSEARRTYDREYRSENKERTSAYGKKWKEQNRDAVATSWRNRRARITNAGAHTVAQTRTLYVVQDGCCANCDSRLQDDMHLDHWMPLSLGGSNTIENLQWLCRDCNLGKGSADPIVWLARQKKASHWPKQN
ncbi:5-methylcytosine-specific restriction endonuclease McrA [Paraburkholderia phenoliruptrix]|uniref:HNH endonuclease n=1 Tax=Paraburkholderia phenoliruptrix TaxID=252970 RepID=UPI002855BE38|nr:HNH endonuclease [Paraburkholderia phenoliruptrix]MDR6421282.1 5-methylcytosine-specific restriction endonuclease McrA [Paraburkholderia phenoliruptrix]